MARVILADPPWEYRNRHSTRQDGGKSRFGIGVASRYSKGVMSLQDICDLPIKKIADKDCYLFMWATWPNLQEALDVIRAWGFSYKTAAFVWHKVYKNGDSFYGPGRYVPSNTEPVLFATRGSPFTPNTGWKPLQVIEAPHPRDPRGKIIHSRKPVECYERIEKWLSKYSSPDEDWVELFATQEREGWTSFGFDVTGRDIREDLEEYIKSGNG